MPIFNTGSTFKNKKHIGRIKFVCGLSLVGDYLFENSHLERSVSDGNSLAVQWLRLHTSTARDTGPIPGWGIKILHVMWQKKKKKERERNKDQSLRISIFSLRKQSVYLCVCLCVSDLATNCYTHTHTEEHIDKIFCDLIGNTNGVPSTSWTVQSTMGCLSGNRFDIKDLEKYPGRGWKMVKINSCGRRIKCPKCG